MMYVLDSSVIIDMLRNKEFSASLSTRIGEATAVTTSIAVHELFAGADTPKAIFVFNALFSGMEILEHDFSAGRMGGVIEQELAKAGTKIKKMDVLIASICKIHNATIVTRDTDFKKIKGLQVMLV